MKLRWPACCIRGFTLIDVVTTLSVIAILAGIALPRFDNRRVDIMAAQRLVIAKLRLARTNAITKSVHFRVSFPTASQIQVASMQENPPGSGTWQVDSSNVQTIPLPNVTQIQSSEVGTSIEFNSRGIAVNLTAPQQIDARDTFGVTKSLQVWPSGQVNEL
jgi:prepilin-type N-terminal cleavage/methylation domain-containing protein